MLTAKAKYGLKALALRTTVRRYRSLVPGGHFQSGVDSHRAALHEGLPAAVFHKPADKEDVSLLLPASIGSKTISIRRPSPKAGAVSQSQRELASIGRENHGVRVVTEAITPFGDIANTRKGKVIRQQAGSVIFTLLLAVHSLLHVPPRYHRRRRSVQSTMQRCNAASGKNSTALSDSPHAGIGDDQPDTRSPRSLRC
jgi:hypothetical protein